MSHNTIPPSTLSETPSKTPGKSKIEGIQSTTVSGVGRIISNHPRDAFLHLGAALSSKIEHYEGREHLESVHGTGAIFTTSHLNDQSIPIVASELMEDDFDILIASQSTNFTHPLMRSLQWIAGGNERFTPISAYKQENDQKTQGSEWGYRLNPEDFRRMFERMNDTKSLVIAAHRPTQDGELPKSGGVASIIAAYLSGKPIVPTMISRDRKTIVYGEPIVLDGLTEEDITILKNWVKKGNKSPQSSQNRLIREILKKIKQDSDRVFRVFTDFYRKNENTTSE